MHNTHKLGSCSRHWDEYLESRRFHVVCQLDTPTEQDKDVPSFLIVKKHERSFKSFGIHFCESVTGHF